MFNYNFFKMKKLPVVLFAVLFLAIAVLFYFQFKSNNKPIKSNTPGIVNEAPGQGIVFVNIDTVIFNLNLFRDRRDELMPSRKMQRLNLIQKVHNMKRVLKITRKKLTKAW